MSSERPRPSAPLYPELPAKQSVPRPSLFIIADFTPTADEHTALCEKVGGKLVAFDAVTFTNRRVADVIAANPRACAFWLDVRKANLWLSANLREVREHSVLAVTARTSRQPWIRTVEADQIMKRSDLEAVERLVDDVTGELMPFLHINRPPGCVMRFLAAIWKTFSKGNQGLV